MKNNLAPTAHINPARRNRLRQLRALAILSGLTGFGWLKPLQTLAAEWDPHAFNSKNLNEALNAHGSLPSTESKDITIIAPEMAENGAQVFVSIISNIPHTQNIAIFIEKNPRPLAASFNYTNGAQPQVRLPLKLSETTQIRAVIKTSNGKNHHAQRIIQVTLGGCAS